MRSGQLAIYEIHPATTPTDITCVRASSLAIKFVKVLSQAFDIQKPEENEKSILAEQKRISHSLIPFVTTPASGSSFSGVFLTGDRPSWILATNKSGVRIHPSGYSVVHSFTACSVWDSRGDFLLYADDVSPFRCFLFFQKDEGFHLCRVLDYLNGSRVFTSAALYRLARFLVVDLIRTLYLTLQRR